MFSSFIEKKEVHQDVLSQNEPNPFTKETSIHIHLPEDISFANLSFHDLNGKQHSIILIPPKGSSTVVVKADKFAAGIYIYSIIAEGKILDSKSMIVADVATEL